MPQVPPVPGLDGSPVPDWAKLIRMANEPKVAHLSPEMVRRVEKGQALPTFFDLSSEDKKQVVPRLSVWVEGLTSVAQAWTLVGANPARTWVVRLEADEVRRIFAPVVDRLPPTPALDIHWERATTVTEAGDRVPEFRSGWEGHAGIANLDKGNKTQRHSLRWQLAECADIEILTPGLVAALVEPEEPRS